MHAVRSKYCAFRKSIDQADRLASVVGGRCGKAGHLFSSLAQVLSRLAVVFCCCGVPPGPAFAALPEMGFEAVSVEYEDRHFDNVRGKLDGSGGFSVSFDRMTGPGQALLGEGLELTGQISQFSYDTASAELTGSLEARGLRAAIAVRQRPGNLTVELKTNQQPLPPLLAWPGLPDVAAWVSRGTVDSRLVYQQTPDQPAGMAIELGVADFSFDSPDGRFAGEGLKFELNGSWPDLDAGIAAMEGAVLGGELLVDEFYREFSGAALHATADLRWSDEALNVAALHVGDDDALTVEASAVLDLASENGNWAFQVQRLEMDFPQAYRRYLEAMAGAWALNGLEVTGRLRWNGEWVSGTLASGDLEISDFSIIDTSRERFAVTGLEARLRPGDYSFDSRLAWRGLLLGRVNLGAGQAALDMEPDYLALKEPLRLDVLGGRLELGALRVGLPGRSGSGGEPDVQLRARIERLDMGQLTAALDWPAFSGQISGEIPGASLNEGVLSFDGEIRVDVFDGSVALRDLSIERAFGVLPSLAADVTISNLDLEQLTQTFSFGRIAGRLDGYVRDLRMLDWRPVAFEAWLGTPERQQGSNDISRQAVNRLTTIGGGPATSALASPLMRMFSSFSYRRLGLGCHLQNNVCDLRGLSEDEQSVLIMEGAGVPKITIRAFNRHIDWPQLVSNLLSVATTPDIEVSAGGGVP